PASALADLQATFGSTGAMAEARSSHVAVRLHDGRVLVAGGINAMTRLATAELFDPGTGAWSSVANMNFPRLGHAAVLLGDGRVLVIGGARSNNVVEPAVGGSAELFDPATGTWSPTGSMADQRIWTSEDASAAGFLVVLADGKVLTAGGVSRPDNFGANDLYLKSAELYDPATGTWSPAGDMLTPRSEHQLTLLATGQVLATGGRFSGALLDGAEVFDPGTGMFSDAG